MAPAVHRPQVVGYDTDKATVRLQCEYEECSETHEEWSQGHLQFETFALNEEEHSGVRRTTGIAGSSKA